MNQPGSAPRYAVLSFTGEQTAIVAHGATSAEVFQQQFLDGYALEGERHHPGKDWTVHGTLVATDGATVVAVPIVTWPGPDGAVWFLCQDTDDGTPPALSAMASSESALLEELTARLRADSAPSA